MDRVPSIVPSLPSDVTVHMVLDDFGKIGRVWRELDEEGTSERDIIQAIITGQFKKPVCVIAFNVDEGWCRDVTEDIARAVLEQAHRDRVDLSLSGHEFYERATGEDPA